MRNSKYRYLLPNAITFASLACGVVAILTAATGNIWWAGILILASYILDLLDGEVARRLNAGSDFGKQLDSLVDVVSLGTAPAVLAFFHLRAEGDVNMALVSPLIVVYVLAGTFRLARFNLLPTKEGQTDSVGLTISTAGATLTLAILSDISNGDEVITNYAYLLLLFFLSLLMVSRIAHPSISWVFSHRWMNLLYMVYFGIVLFLLKLSFFHAWFLFNGGYLGAALARAGLRVAGD